MLSMIMDFISTLIKVPFLHDTGVTTPRRQGSSISLELITGNYLFVKVNVSMIKNQNAFSLFSSANGQYFLVYVLHTFFSK